MSDPDFGKQPEIVEAEDIRPLLVELDRFIKKHKKKGRDPIEIAAAITNSLMIIWDMVPPATQLNLLANLTGFLGAMSQRADAEMNTKRTLTIRDRN